MDNKWVISVRDLRELLVYVQEGGYGKYVKVPSAYCHKIPTTLNSRRSIQVVEYDRALELVVDLPLQPDHWPKWENVIRKRIHNLMEVATTRSIGTQTDECDMDLYVLPPSPPLSSADVPTFMLDSFSVIDVA